MRPQVNETKASWSSVRRSPVDGEALELMEEREDLLDDVAECAQAVDAHGVFAGDGGQEPALRSSRRLRLES
jgi:hypothetical protein